VIRQGSDGYIVSYGDALYRSLDAVERLAEEGIFVGLINKCHLNVVDNAVMQTVGRSPFVLVVESQNTKTGLGIRFGTWLLERGLSPRLARCGTHKDGCGGQWEQAYHQGYDSESVMKEVRKLVKVTAMNKVVDMGEVHPCSDSTDENESTDENVSSENSFGANAC